MYVCILPTREVSLEGRISHPFIYPYHYLLKSGQVATSYRKVG